MISYCDFRYSRRGLIPLGRQGGIRIDKLNIRNGQHSLRIQLINLLQQIIILIHLIHDLKKYHLRSLRSVTMKFLINLLWGKLLLVDGRLVGLLDDLGLVLCVKHFV